MARAPVTPLNAGVRNALMVMPGARRLLAGNSLLERALPPRGFSRDTARQILSFLMQANLTGPRSSSSHRGR